MQHRVPRTDAPFRPWSPRAAPARKTLIVPGLDGASVLHWQHWWAVTDPHALMVDLSWPERPMPVTWEVELASTILHHPDAILVGHGLGAVLIARLLATWPHLQVGGALLVAPCDPAADPRTAGFAPLPATRMHVPVTLAASRNDPALPFDHATRLAAAWGADLVDLGDAASGHGPWPLGKALRDVLLARGGARGAAGGVVDGWAVAHPDGCHIRPSCL